MKEFTTFQALLKPLTKELITSGTLLYNTDYYSKSFKTHTHLMVLLYAQFQGLESLRDLEIAFENQVELLRH